MSDKLSIYDAVVKILYYFLHLQATHIIFSYSDKFSLLILLSNFYTDMSLQAEEGGMGFYLNPYG